MFSLSLASSNPCLEFEPGTSHCKNCQEGYKLALIDKNTTLCASFEGTSCQLDDPYYLEESSFNQTFELVTMDPSEKQYCFNCTTFYTLPSGENLCYSGCPLTKTYDTIISVNINKQSLGCDVCAHQDYQMKTIEDYGFIDLRVKTCTANIEDIACNWKEFYDPELKKCVSCLDRYPKCASCNQEKCLIHIYQYYQGHNLFNYSSGTYDMDVMNFFLCGPNQRGFAISNQCYDNNIPHCKQGWLISGIEIVLCIICEPQYITNFGTTCDLKDNTKTEYTYFIKSGALYNSSEDLNSKYLDNTGDSPSSPYFFLSQAIQKVISDSKTILFQNVTVYLGKGDHFFFYCNLLSGTIPHAPGIVQYCETYKDKLDQEIINYDYYKFYFKPLYCSLASELGYEGDLSFMEMCIEEGMDSNPTVIVNQAYAYFQIYYFARFENIHFSGLNQLVQTVIEGTDLSVLPLKYCQLVREPEVGEQMLELQKINYDDFHVNYKCIDKSYTGSTFPQWQNSNFNCERNKGQHFYQEQESTLTASGEPNHPLYFTQQNQNIHHEVQSKRTNTLFNLMALPEFLSNENVPPELQIVNCTFEYFLQDYESLINVQTKDFYSLQYGNNSHSPMRHETFEYMSSFSADRGAKVLIQNSTFKHSRFSKGLLSYRKQQYISNQQFGFGNFSYYYMDKYPFKQDDGSFIVIESSHFYNLNSGFQNISALALYGGQELTRTVQLEGISQQYQGFIHKGTVLNIEDFGGYIYIMNSTFEYNMHMIPQIYNTPQESSSMKTFADFVDSSQTKEIKMAICDEDSQTDRYFLTHGVQAQDDIDSFYTAFERLSTIYISRNRGPVIVKDSQFHSNIGTFGGALSINSQDWAQGEQPYVIIHNNNFSSNMAYLSGNALYIRNTLKDMDENKICGGLSLTNNNFQDNVGGNHHSNGGAASISCEHVGSELQQDYGSTSTQIISEGEDYLEQMTGFANPHTNETFHIYKYRVNIENNTFKENLAGNKGTALHLKHLSSIRIFNCSFDKNGPLLSQLEAAKSPYVKYLSKRGLAFTATQENCQNEFDFASHCMMNSLTKIQWSHVQGSVFVEHCQKQICLARKTIMDLQIDSSVFNNNQIGYIMDTSFPQNVTSQIGIAGGLKNTIQNCQFEKGIGLYSSLVTDTLRAFFPTGYFESQQGSLISIVSNPEFEIEQTYQTFLINCTFLDNKHFQTLGLGKEMQFYGSLVQIYSLNLNMSSLQIPILQVHASDFRRNSFIGENTQLIYAQNALVHTSDSVFSENGGLISNLNQSSHAQDSSKYFPFSHYREIYHQDYGLFYIEGFQTFPNKMAHSFINNTFEKTFTQKSCILHLNIGNQSLLMSNNTFAYNIASQGAIISANSHIFSNLIYTNNYQEDETLNMTILIENSTFHDQISYEGLFSLILEEERIQINLFIMSSSFRDTFQFGQFGLLSLQKMGKVLVQDCNFSIVSSASELEKTFNQSISLQAPHSFSEFLNQIFQDSRHIYFTSAKFLTANATANKKNEIYFKDKLLQISEEYFRYIEVIDCSFDNFYSSQMGALATLQQASSLIFRNTQNGNFLIRNCSVEKNGLIYVDNSNFVGINLNVAESYSRQTTAILYLTQGSSSQVYNSNFTNNSAENYGMVYITGSSSFLCDKCHFVNNLVAIDSSILYADNNPNGFIAIKNSLCKENKASSNLMSLVSTRTLIENSQFIDNFAQLINNGLTATNSEVTLKNVLVNYTRADYILNNNFEVDTCFLNINFQSILTLDSTIIQNCRGGTAGILQASGHSSIYVKNNSRFLDNKSSVDGSGSAMFFSATQDVRIEDSFFSGNGIIDLYILRSVATIVNSSFDQGEKQFIYGQAAGINIINSTFQNSKNFHVMGQGLSCYCDFLLISNSTFRNLSAVKGGALYLTSHLNEVQFLIENSYFEINSAQQGGAIFVQDAHTLILRNNTFKENAAEVVEPATQQSLGLLKKGLGGSLFLTCQNTDVNLENNCTFRLEDQNYFLNNEASNDGGAIFSVANSHLDDETNVFEMNKAPYGKDFASYPSYLEIWFVSNNDYFDLQSESGSWVSGSEIMFDKIVSGVPFAFLVYIKDQVGHNYYTDNESTATLKNTNSSQDFLLNGNEVKAVNGLFNFSSIVAITDPGSARALELEINGMYDFGNSISFLEEPTRITLAFRSCVGGEEMLNNACQPCSSGHYLYEAPVQNTNCQPCNEHSICEGKNIVYPIGGYWRERNTSDDWIACPRPDSCLQGDVQNLTGRCDEGYQGQVCGECSPGYSKIGDFECGKCPSKTGNIVKMTFISLALCIVIFCLVFATFRGSKRQKAGASVYVKILASHFQIIGVLANVKFTWPSHIQVLYNSLVEISKVTEQVLSIDCLIEGSSISGNLGTYFAKLLMYGVLPIALAFADLLFWLMVACCKGSLKSIGQRFVSTLVILLFLVHPMITERMFQAFSCVDIGGVYYLRDDIRYECYRGQHLKFIIILIIPSIIIWCFGIPLFALIIILRHKTLIKKEVYYKDLTPEELAELTDFRIKYGFIINGFKTSHFFYEVVIQFRKVVLIMLTVILSVVSTEIQALLSLLVLILSMFYQFSKNPFLTKQLNQMEILSLLVSIITLYAGLYFITGQHYSYYQSKVMQWIFLLLILIPNALFLIYWLFHFYIEFLKQIHHKSQKLFCVLSLGLCKYDKFEARYMQLEYASTPISPLKPTRQEDQSFIKNDQQMIYFEQQQYYYAQDQSAVVEAKHRKSKKTHRLTEKVTQVKLRNTTAKNVINLSESEDDDSRNLRFSVIPEQFEEIKRQVQGGLVSHQNETPLKQKKKRKPMKKKAKIASIEDPYKLGNGNNEESSR